MWLRIGQLSFDQKLKCIKILKKIEGETSLKINSYKFEIKNELIYINSNIINRKLFNTIKWIDDTIDVYLRKEGIIANWVISKNKINDAVYAHKGFKFINFDMTKLKMLKEWSMIRELKILSKSILFDFDFYSAIKYTKIINLKTENGTVKFKVGRVNSHNKIFTISWIGKFKDYVNVRVHHMCETSEIFDSVHCDCKIQLNEFKKIMYKEGGVLIYAHEEGRGLGLFNKVNAYHRTEKYRENTVDAMISIAGKTENRLFEIPADIIFQMGIKKINLFTNNKLKINPFSDRGISVKRKSAWYTNNNVEAKKYMKDKVNLMEHYENNNQSDK